MSRFESAPPRPVTLLNAAYRRFEQLFHEVAKFGVVGLIALVIDVGLFNLLRFAGDPGLMYDKPLTAKVVSVVAATTFAYFGNRYWTFRNRGRTTLRAASTSCSSCSTASAWASRCSACGSRHYALGFTSRRWPTTSRERGGHGPRHDVPVLVLPPLGVPCEAGRPTRPPSPPRLTRPAPRPTAAP